MKAQSKAYLQILMVLLALGYALWDFRQNPWTPMRVVGAFLAIAGFGLWAVSRIQLGQSFAIRAHAKALVSSGIYSKIRNPVYVFGTVGFAGIVLLFGRPGWLALLAIIVPMQIWRARREARVLKAKFGDEYCAYRRKTWF